MKAKLIKKDDHYFLEVEPYKWTPLNEFPVIVANTFDKPKGDILQLSLKNCQAIERGYDFDIYNEAIGYASIKGHPDPAGFSNEQIGLLHGYIDGFKKAIEILGDKKFREEDLEKAITKSWYKGAEESYKGLTMVSDDDVKEIIQSLQQKEWDVTIETTCDGLVTGLCMPEVCDCNIIHKRDADGCLILKRI